VALATVAKHVQICHASNGFFSKEDWTVLYTFCLEIAQNIDFRRVTLMLHIGMWVFRSPYSDIVMIYCTADVECHFVTELHLFQEMIIGTRLILVTVNRNQAGACDLHLTIVVPFGCGMV